MNNQRRKLIFLWNYLEWGGAQIYFLAIIKEARKNWDVTVILPKKSGSDIVEFIIQLGVKYQFIDVWLDNSPALTVPQKLKRQWRRIHAEVYGFFYLQRFDLRNSIVHTESAPWQSWIFLAALALRGNVFVTVHNALSKTSKWREIIWKLRLKLLFKLKNFHVFTANEDAKNSLKKFVGGGVSEKIKVTSASINPLETEAALKPQAKRADVYRQLGLPDDKFTVLCVGQFVDRKGRWIFLEAAQKVGAIDGNTIFVWLMPKLPDVEIVNEINNLQVENIFYPVLSENVGQFRAAILEFIGFCDLYVLPSLAEGLPISLLEAMALKKCCISTAVNAIPEAVKHRETGWLIDANDAEQLAEAILTLKNNKKLRENLAENARKFVLKNFDERVTAQTAIAEYNRCFE